MSTKGGKNIFVAIVIVAVVAAVIAGLIALGPPSEERERRLDGNRVADLRSIARSMDVYYTRNENLPGSLDELSSEPGLRADERDPATGQPYEYRILQGNQYELCADFAQESSDGASLSNHDFWSHGAGRRCFQLEAKKLER